MSISNPRQTFLNPTLPFAGTLLGGLLPGEMILIQGSVPKDSDRFQVDLTCGSSISPRADVAFHFNPRFRSLFKSPCVVTNTLQAEKWQKEEITNQNPFSPGHKYEILILVTKDSFKVAVNGAHLLEYRHRVELRRVDTLTIFGKVTVEAIGVLPNDVSVSPPVSVKKSSNSQMNPVTSSSGDLSVPFSGSLLNGLTVGRSFTIKAQTTQHADRFCIDLQCGSSDIALHLNPRLNKKQFVRNSLLIGCWGQEEKTLEEGGFPFTQGEYFEMIVLVKPEAFRVAVNGNHQFDFKHRVRDLKTITELKIYGDLTLMDVQIL